MTAGSIADTVVVKVEPSKRKLRGTSARASEHIPKQEVVIEAKRVKLEDGSGVAVKFVPASSTPEYTGPFPHLQRPTPAECRVHRFQCIYFGCQRATRSINACMMWQCMESNTPCAGRVQAARDALAALHGEPRRAQLGENKHAAADSLHTHTQQTVLDSLVRASPSTDIPLLAADEMVVKQIGPMVALI